MKEATGENMKDGLDLPQAKRELFVLDIAPSHNGEMEGR